jgi:histidinol dehydrogenase
MNVIPARVAGVSDIIMATPPGKDKKVNPYTLVAACEAGCKRIFKIGGAQAIAALAFGTKTIPRVDKIVGPGNIYVALAKKEVYGYVDIDMIAGPSEVMVLADCLANPAFVAADLMSQAEHDPMASAILVTTSIELASRVLEELQRQVEGLSSKDIIQASLRDFGALIVVDSIEQAIELTNSIAPEHLELAVHNPFEILGAVKHSGSIFLGHYTPEPVGDYMAGPNHVLPTGGTARFFSPLGVYDFVKKSNIIFYTEKALKAVSHDVIEFANREGLTAHANSIKVRFKDNG